MQGNLGLQRPGGYQTTQNIWPLSLLRVASLTTTKTSLGATRAGGQLGRPLDKARKESSPAAAAFVTTAV